MTPKNARYTVYKLTDQRMQTWNGYQWVLNEPHETSGEGGLCGLGWLHAYTSPYLAVLLNFLHADFRHPRLFRGEAWGAYKADTGLKVGYTRMVLREELPVPEFSKVQRVAFAIFCAQAVCDHVAFRRWAKRWLSGEDRTRKQAEVVAEEARNTATSFREVYRLWRGDTAEAAWAAAAESVRQIERAAGAASSAAWAAQKAGIPINMVALAKRAYNFERE